MEPVNALEPQDAFVCPRCGRTAERSTTSPHMCVDCEKAENSRITYYRQHQEDWVNAAKECGIDLWLQQPGETQWEYTIWCTFRDSYPGKKPTYGSVAKQLNTTYNVVRKVAQRWSFPVRMQAWMSECDKVTLTQRRQEILDMNKQHIDMAAKLRSKMDKAIEAIDPTFLKPSDIASLSKLATELERKARLDTIEQEEVLRDLSVDNENPELKKSPTKQGDLSEIVGILLKAGALGDITQIGVRQTTEVVVRDDNGNSNSIVTEG